MKRALEHNPKLAAQIQASAAVAEDGTCFWTPSTDRVRNVVVKLARGHAAFELCLIQTDEPSEIIIRPLLALSFEEREEFERTGAGEFGGWPEVNSRAFLRAIIYLRNQPRKEENGMNKSISGVVTLLELLRLYAQNYVRTIHCVAQVATALTTNESQAIQRDLVISALGIFDGIKPQLEAAGLKNTVSQLERIETQWNSYYDYRVFSMQCAELLLRLEDELKSRVLLILSEDVQALYANPRTGWEECILRLPQTTDNVDEMNKCFALARYGASIFHSLLIAEAGLMKLGTYIDVTDPKLGWDATCKMLDMICKAGRTPYAGVIAFNSIEQINQAAQSMKIAWRNKVSHEAGRLILLDSEFNDRQAHEIIMTTRSFMRWIAKEIPAEGQ